MGKNLVELLWCGSGITNVGTTDIGNWIYWVINIPQNKLHCFLLKSCVPSLDAVYIQLNLKEFLPEKKKKTGQITTELKWICEQKYLPYRTGIVFSCVNMGLTIFHSFLL